MTAILLSSPPAQLFFMTPQPSIETGWSVGKPGAMQIQIRNRCSDFNSYRAARVKSLFNAESGCTSISTPTWTCPASGRSAWWSGRRARARPQSVGRSSATRRRSGLRNGRRTRRLLPAWLSCRRDDARLVGPRRLVLVHVSWPPGSCGTAPALLFHVLSVGQGAWRSRDIVACACKSIVIRTGAGSVQARSSATAALRAAQAGACRQQAFECREARGQTCSGL